MDVTRIQQKLRVFAKERDWDQFHNPKNLVMALAGEVGELIELFQWLDFEQSAAAKEQKKLHQSVEEELADVLIYLLRLADILDVDLEDAVEKKIALNHEKYPVTKAKGRADKYKDL